MAPKEVRDIISGTDWKELKDVNPKYLWRITKDTGKFWATLSERRKWTEGGITFDLIVSTEGGSVKICFSQSSINQFKNGESLCFNAIAYAAQMIRAHIENH